MVHKFKHGDIDKLCQHLGDDLDDDRCMEIRKEVNECPDCSLILDEIRGTIELYRKAMPHEKLPDDAMDRLKIKLHLPRD